MAGSRRTDPVPVGEPLMAAPAVLDLDRAHGDELGKRSADGSVDFLCNRAARIARLGIRAPVLLP